MPSTLRSYGWFLSFIWITGKLHIPNRWCVLRLQVSYSVVVFFYSRKNVYLSKTQKAYITSTLLETGAENVIILYLVRRGWKFILNFLKIQDKTWIILVRVPKLIKETFFIKTRCEIDD